ncbi:MAG: glycosyltransferase family protein [Methanoregula sp.]|nr:glycosyltransferase family protein [Methanoregula sp.]
MIAAIIQARMGSTRLPGKVLMNLAGKPVLWHIITRLQQASRLDNICVATTIENEDNCIEEACRLWQIPVYRGSLNDVLSRYYECAKLIGMQVGKKDYIVRITADCPFVDPTIVDILIEKAVQGNYDYVSNIDPPTFPDGLDVEVFRFDALEIAVKEARLNSEREHVTPYIRNNKSFLKNNHASTTDLSNIRLTIDTCEDYQMIAMISNALYHEGEIISLKEILILLDSRSDILAINAQYKRNEGYETSLCQNRIIQGD